MKKSAQKIHATTQQFTEIQDVKENVVLLTSGNACSIIEVKATNFALLSQGEQQAKMLSYATLLNSLSFAIQIVIQNKKFDISSYLKLLELAEKNSQGKLLANQIGLYRNFVAELVKENSVLDKKFYIVISYSYLEKGPIQKKSDFFSNAKLSLLSKADAILNQLARINLSARTLVKDELIKVFYEFYNNDLAIQANTEEPKNLFVKSRSAG